MMDIVFDFDGVLCEYHGWRGHSNFGEPIKENIELVKNLFDEGHKLKLSTTRLNPYPFGEGLMDEPDELVLSGEAKERIMDWLQKQGILGFFKEITGYKPFGNIYIDDRAMRYDKDISDSTKKIKLFIDIETERNKLREDSE